ncbi:MAG: methyl-accepting chemotaxis protein [Tissierellia bacterium]|nr:methyl-accepting chemotaxis protein [Tissierellia bacterium]
MIFKKKKSTNKIRGTRAIKSVKGKLVSVIFILMALLMTTTTIIISLTVNSSFTIDKKDLLKESAHSISHEAELFFERFITIVEQMATDRNIQNYLAATKEGDIPILEEISGYEVVVETLLESQKLDEDIILSTWIAEDTPSENINCFAGSSDETYDITTRGYYRTITEGVVNISDPYVDYTTNSMAIAITAPVYSKGKIVGLTGIDISIDALANVVKKYELGETGFFTLLTQTDIVTSHRDEDNLLKNVREIGLSDNMLESIANKSEEIIDYTYGDEEFLGDVMEIGDTGWKIVSGLPKAEFTADTNALIRIIIIIYVIIIIILSAIIYIVIGIFTKPIVEVTKITNKLADGELDVSIDVKSNDEIGELAKSIYSLTNRLKSYIVYIDESVDVLNDISNGNLVMELKNDYQGEFAKLKGALYNVSNTLKETIGKIKTSADSINANAEQVSSGSQVLAQGTTEQASAIEELSAEINEIYSTIIENANNAENAGKIALESSYEIDRGNEKMREMLTAMDEISESSNEIYKIIKVIDDIAFQTNILALNAAVEAARAGSAGKGFAVVADEVRNLAGKSAEAAKQTTVLIESSINAINKGTALADETGKSLEEIVNKAKLTGDLVKGIVESSTQQTVSVNQIKGGIEQISSVVQENAATAEASASNSEELSGQSHILKDLVSQFEV